MKKALIFGLVVIGLFAAAGCGGSSGSSKDKLIGNYHFFYNIITEFDGKVTITEKSAKKSDEGQPIYKGEGADYPSLHYVAVMSWSPQFNAYIMGVDHKDGWLDMYVFNIDSDNHLSGTYAFDNNGVTSNFYNLNSSKSRKYDSGKWARSLARFALLEEARMAKMTEAAQVAGQPGDQELLGAVRDLLSKAR